MSETFLPDLPEKIKANENQEKRTGLTTDELDLIVATAIKHADLVMPLPEVDSPIVLVGPRHRRHNELADLAMVTLGYQAPLA
jgi:hypothetical protein